MSIETSSPLQRGSIRPAAWGRMTRKKAPARPKPSAPAASHWPLSTPPMPALRMPDTVTAKRMAKVRLPTAAGRMRTEPNTTKYSAISTTSPGTPCRKVHRASAARRA